MMADPEGTRYLGDCRPLDSEACRTESIDFYGAPTDVYTYPISG